MIRDPFTMVVAIIAIITFGKIIRAKINARHGIIESRDVAGAIQQRFTGDQDENGQLRSEIATLKERIQVLERIATDGDRGASLSREIEGLRDK